MKGLQADGRRWPSRVDIWIEASHLGARNRAVPIYEYELCEGDCQVCGGKFTLRRPLSAAPLTQCPACKKPVRKVLSTFNSPMKLKPLSISDAKKAGFSVLKRVNKGEYERQ
jgi:putative FmdB family regulatory protein